MCNNRYNLTILYQSGIAQLAAQIAILAYHASLQVNTCVSLCPRYARMTCFVGTTCFCVTSAFSPSVCTFIALEIVSPRALRQAIPVSVIRRAAQGWEKTNIAVTLSA